MIIAIDGPAASGKGTLAKRLAVHYRLPHLDTGMLYRAVARAMLDNGLPLDDVAASAQTARMLDVAAIDESRLRGRMMGEAASVIAVHGSVREALLRLQQRFAHQPGGAVLDGRDIGTVICPEADKKLYVTASAEERARRRTRELIGRGEHTNIELILADIRARDARDASRAAAPLKAAEDALWLDTTHLDIDAAFKMAVSFVDKT
jgi:cytidylate kinase